MRAAAVDLRALHNWRFAVTGSVTAAALARHGFTADLVPPVFTGAALGEALLERLRTEGASPVVFARADRADAALPARLAGAGYPVVDIVTYKTQTRAIGKSELDYLLSQCDTLVFSSSSAVEAWADALAAGGLPLAATAGVRVCVIGPVTRAAAEARGLRVDVEAEVSSADGLLTALLRDAGSENNQ